MVQKPLIAGMDRYERKVVLIMSVILTVTVFTLFITSGLDVRASAIEPSIISPIQQQEAVLR
jgi:hypothetical protein